MGNLGRMDQHSIGPKLCMCTHSAEEVWQLEPPCCRPVGSSRPDHKMRSRERFGQKHLGDWIDGNPPRKIETQFITI